VNGPVRACIIIPCLNEQGVITGTCDVLLGELKRMSAEGLVTENSYVCVVDDGSTDGTWAEITGLCERDPHVRGIKLSANFGHQNALIAGLFTQRTQADVLITIDADLQDDAGTISEMVRKHREGSLVVYGVRSSREVDILPKRVAAWVYYQVLRWMNERSIFNHADFRLADSRVVAELEKFGEANLYLRGLFPIIGYPSAQVFYERKERTAGDSKYPYRKLISLAWQGITSITTTPLKMVFYTGLLMSLLALAIAAWSVWAVIAGRTLQGWFSTTLIILFFSSVNMISLGVIGEYVGKIYKEVKARPRYIIERVTNAS